MNMNIIDLGETKHWSSPVLLLHSPARSLEVIICDCLVSVQVDTILLWVMAVVEEVYGKVQMNGLVEQNDSGNKELSRWRSMGEHGYERGICS